MHGIHNLLYRLVLQTNPQATTRQESAYAARDRNQNNNMQNSWKGNSWDLYDDEWQQMMHGKVTEPTFGDNYF